MLASDDLIDQYALVRPDLTHDPVQKQNQAGLIISADIGRDDFIVLFPDNKHGLYSSDSLLILKPMEEIHQLLTEHGHILAFPDLKTLTQIDLFLRYGTGDVRWKAFELAASNRNIHELSLDLLKDRLGLQQSPSLKR
jgi:hypothetical protein